MAVFNVYTITKNTIESLSKETNDGSILNCFYGLSGRGKTGLKVKV
ncbi:hypothetical protein [Draconibacterium halophilum]|uniref:Uncharacterized protein n=1 Tax=Draconibacterium halophilum TaxID=2706887 RepID=A0A6C0RFJ6_9BACT|nr:hypothetical protein [Draconibacterium halophilum]QIA09180.1 hypothetical protein G0Q07_16300 [Draconibacterium halophilum]